VIHDYLDRLAILARVAGLDADRLVTEIADHLEMATTAYETAGSSREEAEDMALTAFGDAETIVARVRAEVGQRTASTPRVVGSLVSSASLIVLWIAHAAPPSDLMGSSMAPVAVIALASLLGATAFLLATEHPAAGTILGALGAGVVWAFATSVLRDRGIVVMDVSLTLMAAGVIAGGVCIVAHIRGALGFATIAAGLAALILNGSWSELGGLGSGRANTAVILLTVGCSWVTLMFTTPRVTRAGAQARRSAAAFLERTAHYLSPPA
jgi:hypothetical protein